MRSTVRFARVLFSAHSASVFLHRPDSETLVLEATSEQYADSILGIEMPSSQGIAGWVFQTGESIIADELDTAPQFSRDVAEKTGYLPRCILATPLETDGVVFGVVEVLDPTTPIVDSMQTLELLQELSRQCCSSLAALNVLNDDMVGSRFSLERLLQHVKYLSSLEDPAAQDFLRALESATDAYVRR
ncbi:hypothetical protein Cs7R123_79740 [Catellatospora sp. TT07R-123]|nr:hypothetical protein Cs7R123_79740 [Catellatospora sp. TT07R-123]